MLEVFHGASSFCKAVRRKSLRMATRPSNPRNWAGEIASDMDAVKQSGQPD
jgi:hypothetical protein